MPLESAAARVCREAGARVTTNVLVRDLDLGAPEATGARRLEVVADGLPLFGGGPVGHQHNVGVSSALRQEVPTQVPHTGTERRWKWQDVERNGVTRS